ncbi:MAG: hypothetical protein R3C13_01985 [Hyphomonas sp.]|uniref:hypothetical protein n=1 Tax=Hyphomonas sp. TaxID=87 RepID=UPI003527B1F8
MKFPIIGALILSVALPAAAESSLSTLQAYQVQTRTACPALWQRTLATPDFDPEGYSESECGCLADKITGRLWNEDDEDWTGPLMSEADAAVIADAVTNEQTVDDMLYRLTDEMSEDGFTLATSCYFKDDGEDLTNAVSAPATGNNNRPQQSSAPAPQETQAAPAIVPEALTRYKAEAAPLCTALDGNSSTTETQGYFTCACAAGAITSRAWDDYDYDYTGPFMSEADAKLIVDSLKAASNMAQASQAIYGGLSTEGQSVMSSCFSK